MLEMNHGEESRPARTLPQANEGQKSALNVSGKAWEDVIRKFGDDAPDGPLYRAYTADVGVAAYWQDRALRAERRALKRRIGNTAPDEKPVVRL